MAKRSEKPRAAYQRALRWKKKPMSEYVRHAGGQKVTVYVPKPVDTAMAQWITPEEIERVEQRAMALNPR